MRARWLQWIIAFLILSSSAEIKAQFPPDDGLWNLLLDDVTVRYKYSFKSEGFIPKPNFGTQLQALNNTEVNLVGFYLPANITGSSFVVSYYPMAMCFFCTGAGIESVVVMYAADGEEKRFSSLRTDDFIEVKGRLELNVDVNKNLFYILHDAQWVRTIK
ncbi:MAG: DUF3299 domain-containing protein [Bacteroidales bacterium]|nr:DUF3299 domain-containing protein [Bacteroidales bacterium]